MKQAPSARRRAVGVIVSSATVSIAIVVGYFALPLSSALSTATLLVFVGGLGAVVLLLVWQVRSIMSSPYPRLRAIAALGTTLPIFLIVFATTYFLMSRTSPASFNESLSRLDAAYYTVTVFATVGFGDIAPLTPAARATTTLQMIGDIVLVGLVARVIVGAMRRGIRRQEGGAGSVDPAHDLP